MKIAYISAGAGGMICGNCLHDNALASALLQLGQDVILVPIYTPLRTDEVNVSLNRVFFGGINVFLQQKSSFFRHTPWFLDRILDSPALIRSMMSRSVSVDAEDLGALAVSVLKAEDGNQRKEVLKLCAWLRNDVRPDIVHLSNILLSGFAREIKRELNVPVVSTLSGEELFLKNLKEPHTSQAENLLKDRTQDLDALVSLSHFYAHHMEDLLGIPDEKVVVIEHGINLDGHHINRSESTKETHRIGYLARISPEKGLHLLLEALKILSKQADLPRVEVRVAGYLGKSDQPYMDEIQQHADEAGLGDHFVYEGELTLEEKIRFYQSLDSFCLPTVFPSSKGLSVIEAWANGIPAVVPDHGSFSEMIADTGGGLLFEPHNAESLASKLRELILDPDSARSLGEKGHEAVHDRYTAAEMGKRTLQLYESLLDQQQAARTESKLPTSS
ncbi:Glycosyltransferase involved in cell wall bisynthesis [Planctomycetales bacterium 10988]|nr:Glycosyltransferase involved in cell wall bisynthesis [Planctomycetales bacterium 10988]